jgi:hypothetical protein
VREHYGWLADVIPPQSLALLDADPSNDGRRRLLTLDLLAWIGARSRERPIESKTTAYNTSYYPTNRDPGGPAWGVELRGDLARRQMLTHARELDQRLGLSAPALPGAPLPPPGPCERKVRAASPITVAVVGGFCEGSKDLHALIKEIAATAAEKMQHELGMAYVPAKARMSEYLYRDLGVIAARGVARVILERRQYSLPWQYATQRRAGVVGTTGGMDSRLYRAVESIALEERAGRGGGLAAVAAGQ